MAVVALRTYVQRIDWSSRSTEAQRKETGVNCHTNSLITYPYSHTPTHTPTPTKQHVPIGLISDGVDMGWHLMALLATVHVDNLLCVDGVQFVGVHHHTEQA